MCFGTSQAPRATTRIALPQPAGGGATTVVPPREPTATAPGTGPDRHGAHGPPRVCQLPAGGWPLNVTDRCPHAR